MPLMGHNCCVTHTITAANHALGLSSRAGWTTTFVAAGQQLTVRRSSDVPEHRAQLIHLAHLLAPIAEIRGTETLVHAINTDEGTVVDTAFAGGQSVATSRPDSAASLASLGASLFGTLAEIHAAGIAHGPILAEHIIIGRHDSLTICGFASGLRRIDIDDHAWQVATSLDVRSVGTLIIGLLSPPSTAASHHRQTHAADALHRSRVRRIATAIADGTLDTSAEAAAALRRLTPRRRKPRWHRTSGPNR